MFEDLLIKEVEKYPLLYNKCDRLYRNRSVKKKVWAKIANTVHTTQDHCYMRWKSLRDRYVRETTRPAATAAEEQKQWKYIEALSFLKDHVEPKLTTTKKKPQLDMPSPGTHFEPETEKNPRTHFEPETEKNPRSSFEPETQINPRSNFEPETPKNLFMPQTEKCVIRIQRKNIQSHCRTCLKQLASTSSNNELTYDIHQTQDLAKWIILCTSMEVDNKGGYPNYLCQECFLNFETFYNFRAMCIRSLRILDRILDTTEYVLTDATTICDDVNESFHIVRTESLAREEVQENKEGFENETLIDPLENCGENKTLETSLDIIKFENYQIGEETEVENNYESPATNGKDFEASAENFPVKENNLTTETIHMEEEHNDIEAPLSPDFDLEQFFSNQFQCDQCERSYTRASYLKIHKRKKHEDSGEKDDVPLSENDLSLLIELKSQKKPTTIFQCEFCTKRFYSQNSLDIHMQIHKGLQRFQCNQCERSYKNLAHLTAHIREIHQLSGQVFTCTSDGCGKQFNSIRTYRVHCRVNHTKCKRFICEDCGRIYKNSNGLKNHRYTHSSVEEYPFRCDQCGKGFAEQRRYKQHIVRHTEDKKYACTYCGVKKATRSELRSHINHHTKKNKWPCPQCPSVFDSSVKLGRHDRVVHNGIRRYACRYCDQRFANSHTLKHHEMRHTGEKPHGCLICGKRFIQKSALQAHIKRHDKIVEKNSKINTQISSTDVGSVEDVKPNLNEINITIF